MVYFVRPQSGLGRIDPARKVIKAADYASFVDATEVLAAARAEAEAIGVAAQQQYEVMREKGLANGREEARLEASEQMISNASRTIEYFGQVEDRMVQLVLNSTRKIMADFSDTERARAVVKGALSAVRNQKQVVLRVAPGQVDALKAQMNDILSAYPGIGYLDIVADGRLDADGCILETDIGTVESSIQGQIEALRNAFQKVLGARR
jgi:type III secretion protein L